MLAAFKKESTAYFDVIPQFEKIYSEKAKLDGKFAPKSFKLQTDTGTDVLVLENIQIKNFKKCDGIKGLDMQHTEAVLKKLAQFHAASACLFQTAENVPDIYKQTAFAEATKKEMEMLAETFMGCIKHCEGSEEYFSRLVDFKIVFNFIFFFRNVSFVFKKTCSENVWSSLLKTSCVDNHKFKALNQGQCWLDNILFQHDSAENITNTYFVDFQFAQYGTPCYDLLQFLLSSPKLELKLEHFDYFIRYYHENLKSYLELLEYKKTIPELKDLHQDLLDSGVWGKVFYSSLYKLTNYFLFTFYHLQPFSQSFTFCPHYY